MRSKDIAIGLAVLIVVVTAGLLIRKARIDKLQAIPSPTPSIQDKVSEKFGGLTIPDDADKIELKDVSGGDGYGIATGDTVLADLPDPQSGYFYQVWVEKSGKVSALGKMRVAKGGWVFEGKMDGEKVIVSLEKVFDNKIETKILEGNY